LLGIEARRQLHSWKLAQLLGGTTARVNGVLIGASPFTSNFTIAGAGASWGDWSLTSSGGYLYLNLEATSPVPEPNVISSIVFAAAGLAAFRRQMPNR
jgi:hypothetical protein